MGFGVPRLGPYNPETRKQEQKVGMGQWEWENSLQGNVWRSLWWLAWGKGKKNKRGMKQKKEKERKAAVEGAGARLCEGCVWQHLQQHGEHSLPAGQGWTRGQGLENQTKGSRGQCQEPAAGKDQCTTTAQSWGQPCSQGQRRGLRWQLVSVLGTIWCPQVWHFSAQCVPQGDGDTKLHLPASTSPSRESAKLQECPKPPTHTKPGNFGRRGDVLPKNHRVPEPL